MQWNRSQDLDDGTHELSLFCLLCGFQLIGTVLFAMQISWLQASIWFATNAMVGYLRWRNIGCIGFRALPLPGRRQVYRWYTWTSMAGVGSGCFFLYVPDSLTMQAALVAFLVGNATIVVALPTRDGVRSTVALCLAILPTSLRFIVAGFGGSTPLVSTGMGGIVVTIAATLIVRSQAHGLSHQWELRQCAESAANRAVALSSAKSRFFAAVGHDLRQAVHTIGLNLEPLIKLTANAKGDSAQRAAECVRASWRQLDAMLSQVLDLSRMESGVVDVNLQPIDVAPVLRRVVAQFSASAECAAVRVIAFAKPNCYVIADDMMLRRAISNLLDNAIKFSFRGAVVVAVLRYSQAAWRLQIRDAGRGIDQEAQSKIFDEYVQLESDARPSGRGLGLGLAITRRLVLAMKGSIEVRSAPGRGCCMTITLPKANNSSNRQNTIPLFN